MNCDSCGKNLVDIQGSSLVGMSITIRNQSQDGFDMDFVQYQIGNYEIGRTYNICFECLLKKMGVKQAR